MDKLPIEIITHILQYLDWYNKQNASLVCKKWFQAAIDPRINGNVTFIFPVEYDGRLSVEELEGVSRRNIRNLRFGFSTASYKLFNEVRNCSGFAAIAINVINIEVGECWFDENESIVDIFIHCPNLQNLNIYVNRLCGLLQEDTTRNKMKSVLANLSKIILNVSYDEEQDDLEYLMNLPGIVQHVKVRSGDICTSQRTGELTVSIMEREGIPIATYLLFCKKYDCPLSINNKLNPSKLPLASVLSSLCLFPKLTVNFLHIDVHSSSEVKDLHQLSCINALSLELWLNFETENWFTHMGLSVLDRETPSLDSAFLHLKVEQGTLDCILKSLPYVCEIRISQIAPREWNAPTSRTLGHIMVKFKSTVDGKSKWLMIDDTNGLETLINHTSVTFSVIYPQLQLFSVGGLSAFKDKDLVLKLTECFPGLTEVFVSILETSTDQQNQIDLNLFSRLKKLQRLSLRNVYLPKIKLRGVKFDQLKYLDLAECVNLTNECLEEIGRSMPCLESLNISHCCHIGDAGLQTLLESLSNLRVLKLIGCKQVNSTTLKMISTYSSSLRKLFVPEGDEKYMSAITEIHESSSSLRIQTRPDTDIAI